jgi:hypothetical protein
MRRGRMHINGNTISEGLPAVSYVAQSLNVSPNYLQKQNKVFSLGI